MSVARNVWRPADISHIVPATVVDSETAQRLIASCPAGLFSLTAEGELPGQLSRLPGVWYLSTAV